MKGWWEKVPEAVSRSAGCAVVLYVWGFFVFRARLAALGVPVHALPAVDQTYLIHGGEFVVVSLESLLAQNPAITIAFIVVIAGCILGVKRLLGRPDNRTTVRGRLNGAIGRALLSIATVAALAASVRLAASVISRAGPLLLPFDEARPDHFLAECYVAALGLFVCGVFLLFKGLAAPEHWLWHRPVLMVAGGLGLLGGVLLPMAYGAAIQGQDYAVVTLEPSEAAAPGPAVFLLLATDKTIVTYGGGGLRMVPSSKVAAVNVLCRARLAREPHCDEKQPPGVGGVRDPLPAAPPSQR